MNSKFLITISACILLAACSMPPTAFYVRNYSPTPLDVVVIFHGAMPDSAFHGLTLVNAVAIERSLPYKQTPAAVEQLEAKAFKVSIPSNNSLLFPLSRTVSDRMFDSSTVLLVKDHYLVDTLFHQGGTIYMKKFKSERRFFFTHQLFYDYDTR